MSIFCLIYIWPQEIVPWLKALGALAEDSISVPSWYTYIYSGKTLEPKIIF